VDLDLLVKRDTWTDQNKAVVAQEAASIGNHAGDVKGCERGWLSVLQHDDQSEEHHCEGANLDQSCRQRNCVPVVSPDSRASLDDEFVV